MADQHASPFEQMAVLQSLSIARSAREIVSPKMTMVKSLEFCSEAGSGYNVAMGVPPKVVQHCSFAAIMTLGFVNYSTNDPYPHSIDPSPAESCLDTDHKQCIQDHHNWEASSNLSHRRQVTPAELVLART